MSDEIFAADEIFPAGTVLAAGRQQLMMFDSACIVLAPFVRVYELDVQQVVRWSVMRSEQPVLNFSAVKSELFDQLH